MSYTKDMVGREIEAGDTVVRGHAIPGLIELRQVELVQDGKIYLTHSKGQAIKFPQRLLVVEKFDGTKLDFSTFSV